ncbi:hypothetical protein EVAR_9256_1 [Eumeta japonica]|uniref:Uncharacterized protein n=1 Tax=Eumeta variegata TaxID=151549 RepID=A0A4C1TNU6_EUMVA|nr:hypothetical protein EVAR_9256_1 [Eumeta japonica]
MFTYPVISFDRSDHPASQGTACVPRATVDDARNDAERHADHPQDARNRNLNDSLHSNEWHQELEASQKQSRDAHKALRDCRGCKIMKVSKHTTDGASTPAAGTTEAMQVDEVIASITTLECIDIEYVRIPIIKDTFSSS